MHPLRLLQFELRSCVASFDVVAEKFPVISRYRSFQPLLPVLGWNSVKLLVSVPLWIIRAVAHCALALHDHVRAITNWSVPVTAMGAIRNITALYSAMAECSFSAMDSFLRICFLYTEVELNLMVPRQGRKCLRARDYFEINSQLNASPRVVTYAFRFRRSASWFQSPNDVSHVILEIAPFGMGKRT